MTGRLDKTLADYVAIAISPALIMTLVGSLVFFLLEVFYEGEFQGRLTWIMAMFVIAAVLIGRISIEQGTERAAGFALALATATALAVLRFVGFDLVSMLLIALVWWCSHKLTWDCTLINEEEDASGEGLLQIVGLDESRIAEVLPQPELNGMDAPEREPGNGRPATWWERFTHRRHPEGRADRRVVQPHAPGVWVVYFSLAALPIFGIGQSKVPSTDVEARRYVFWLLCVYVASGLGLLLTTSFLGLRRYLRQRRLQMPAAMAGVWIGTGAALIIALLLFTALLPRPASEYAVSNLPFGIGAVSEEQDYKSSRWALGEEGVDDQQRAPRPGKPQNRANARGQQQQEQPDVQGGQASDDSRQYRAGGGAAGDQGKGAGAEDRDSSAGGSSGNGKSAKGEGENKQDQSRGESSKKTGKQSGKQAAEQSQNQSEKRSADRSSEQSGRNRTEDRRQGDSRSGASRGESDDSQEQSDQGRQTTAEQPQRPSPLRNLLPSSLGGWLTRLFRLIFFSALAIAAAIWIRRHWEQLVAAFRQFLNELRSFWENLFGSRKSAEQSDQSQATAEQPHYLPFAAFADPFATGLATRSPPEELVRYSFEALEAWAREQGWPRAPETTPHEFAQLVGTRASTINRDARRLADLYCSVAYAPGRLSPGSVEHLRRFWQHLPPPVQRTESGELRAENR